MRAYTGLRLLDLGSSLGAVDVQQNSADDYQAGEEGLPLSLQATGRQAGLQSGHDEHADQSADHSAGATGHGSTADDNAGNAVHFLTLADTGGDGGVNSGIEQSGQTDKEAGQGVGSDLPPVNIDTGQTRSFFIGADGIEVAAQLGLVQDQRGNDEEQQQPHSADGQKIKQLGTNEDLLEPAAGGIADGRPGLSLDLGEDGAEKITSSEVYMVISMILSISCLVGPPP